MDGLRVGITADRKGAELQDALVRRGAVVTWGPTLRIVPPEYDELIISETDALLASEPEYVVVSTATGLAANRLTATFVSPRETLDDVADWLLAKAPAKATGRHAGARRRDGR